MGEGNKQTDLDELLSKKQRPPHILNNFALIKHL